MSTQVTVTLPDAVYRSAVRLAKLTQRELGDVLTDTLSLSLPELTPEAEMAVPIADLSDAEVLTLMALTLPPVQDHQLTTLLERQQAGSLTAEERTQLAALMQAYREGLLRKAQALQEAVRRGLHEPLTP